MSDYKDLQDISNDFPFGLPGDVWESKNGPIKLADMTVSHIRNCMRIVGEDDEWYGWFERELRKRGVLACED